MNPQIREWGRVRHTRTQAVCGWEPVDMGHTGEHREGNGTAGQPGARKGATCHNRGPKEKAKRDQGTWKETF